MTALMVFSCNTSSDDSTLSQGVDMYNATSGLTMTYAMDPVDMAFRFNIFLNEAVSAKVDLDDQTALNSLEITVEEDKGKETYRLGALLFLYGAKVEVNGNGVYDIVLTKTGDMSSETDGIVRIDTKGKLLDDLAEGELWEISLHGNNETKFQYYIPNYGTEVLTVSGASYSIVGKKSANTWDVFFSGYTLSSNYAEEGFESDWSGEFTVARKGGNGKMMVTDTHGSKFELSGKAFGKIPAGIDMEYVVSSDKPLVYVPECRKIASARSRNYILESGSVKVRFTGEYDSESYPADECEVITTRNGSCGYTLTLHYNGETHSWAFN